MRGRALAGRLSAYAADPDVSVLALPRGGVPVAAEVARALHAPLDVFVVRKLGVPGNEELAMGAIASGGIRTLNADLVAALRIPPYAIDAVAAREQRELERRERLYRGGRAPADLRGRTVILVDDGLATGATMLAAIEALRLRRPAHLVVAVPTASRETLARLKGEADVVVCVDSPEPFHFVGAAYADFTQTSDAEVRRLLGDEGAAPDGDPVPAEDRDILALLRQEAIRLTGEARDYDPLMAMIGEARLVLLGEATHGTQDFYRERAEITKRLIREKGFGAVAIEADWPDAWRVNRYVRGESEDLDAVEALSGFRRFPTWLWRNTEMAAFVEWLHRHNATQPEGSRVGVYGIDLYSLHASMKAVLAYLDAIDPAAAAKARDRYACFDRFGDDSQVYGFMTGMALAPSCEAQAVAQLAALRRRAADSLAWTGSTESDELFCAEQNAGVVRTAEEYYRTMFLREVSSWNLRDTHMADCVGALVAHLGRTGRATKVAVWAHNSHLGDARATGMGERGEINLGQLLHERHGRAVVRIGFTTHSGTVAAAADWGAPVERKRVRPALPGSHEALFHALGLGRFCLIPAPGTRAAQALREGRLQRAIGVIYRPDTERESHYLRARLPDQFEAVVHLDETRAVEPLDAGAAWEPGEVPETFPAGL